MRTLKLMILIGLCVGIGFFAWVLYLKYDVDKLKTALSEKDSRTQNTEIEVSPQRVWSNSPSKSQLTSPNAPQSTSKQQRIQKAMTFRDRYPEATYTQLKADLNAVYPNDPRAERFLELWKAMSDLIQETISYENGGDLKSFLNMKPAETLTEYMSLATELLQLSDTEVSNIQTALAGWVDVVSLLQIANEAVPDIQKAVNSGEMTAAEAETFFKNVFGANAYIEITQK